MKKSFCVALFVINAFILMTHAQSYPESYERNRGERYSDPTGSYVTNFGNGNNQHNIVKMNETPDGLSLSGTSLSNDPSRGPSVQNINVDFKNPNYRGGPQGPNINYNPKGTRTQISNIGNGEGNRNVFLFNDNRQNLPPARNNQGGNNGYRGVPNYGHEGNTRVISNIGKGPDNINQFYVNGQRVNPNLVNNNGVQDTSVNRESLPSDYYDGQTQQVHRGLPNYDFNNSNGVKKLRNYETKNQAPTNNGYTKIYYPVHNYNQVKITNSDFPNVFNDPSLKELPMRT